MILLLWLALDVVLVLGLALARTGVRTRRVNRMIRAAERYANQAAPRRIY
jgi:hypothetical protein